MNTSSCYHYIIPPATLLPPNPTPTNYSTVAKLKTEDVLIKLTKTITSIMMKLQDPEFLNLHVEQEEPLFLPIKESDKLANFIHSKKCHIKNLTLIELLEKKKTLEE
ncbi:25935_t:CDS:2, partial [Gigaspora margarita]